MATPFSGYRPCVRALHPAPASLLCRAVRHTRPYSESSSPTPPANSSSSTAHHEATKPPPRSNSSSRPSSDSESEQGPMARRLEEATEEALLTGGRAGRRAVEDAGFSSELKERLLSKVADAQFRAEYGHALSAAGLDPNTASPGAVPSAAGEGTRAMASGQPWTGEEPQADAVLRMLNDARKPLSPGLRGKPTIPSPVPVDMRLRRTQSLSAGKKAAAAKERASAYTGWGLGKGQEESAKEQGLSDREREALRKEFRDRFSPGARPMPSTISGLAALANERIEDAIARGQFKDIPRGKGVERDSRADNPFIDTTEYIMNKMIKRQEIVPPWIEKQQELVRAAHVFRARLRNDWKRHAARMIASRGGSLQEQMGRALEYARAEEVHNPRRRNVDEIAVPTNVTNDPVMAKVREQAWAPSERPSSSSSTPSPPPASAKLAGETDEETPLPTLTQPFRDPDWEAAERSYMKLAVENLNALTRSYNLLAPDLAKKPYFSLERELQACFADVAPILAHAIKERAERPSRSLVGSGSVAEGRASILDRFGREGKTRARIYDSKAPHYGFKEMWRDLWNRPDS